MLFRSVAGQARPEGSGIGNDIAGQARPETGDTGSDLAGPMDARLVSRYGWPERDACDYTAYYCEENAYRLAGRLMALPVGPVRVVFVTSRHHAVPAMYQRAGRGRVVVWDYHVFVMTGSASLARDEPPEAAVHEKPLPGDWPLMVWDLDTVLGFPVQAGGYFARTFPTLAEGTVSGDADPTADSCDPRSSGADSPDGPDTRDLSPCFRIIDATDYLNRFSSDRHHMRLRDGRWSAPPPPLPPIRAPGARGPHELDALLDLSDPSWPHALKCWH